MKSLIRTTAVALSMIFVVSLSQCGGGPQQSAPSLAITTASLPNGTSEVAYSQTIQASGVVYPEAKAEAVRAILAKHIIEAAKQGERDHARLRDGALLALAQSNLRNAPPPPPR